MDSTRFDRLARTIGRSRSRRQVLRSLAGLAAGGLVLGGQERTYAQACKANGKTCKKDTQCCSKNCVGDTGTGSTAHSAGVCQPTATGCDGGLTECSGGCVDLATNLDHCGSCDDPCTAPDNATATCAAGGCDFTCDDGFTECSGACVDLDTDPAHCGACDTPCATGDCRDGKCCTTGTCGSLTCPATADICTGTGLSCGSGTVSCYCHVVPVASGGTASVCGSRTECFENLQDCTPGDPCNYNGTNDGICISCGGCISCFKPCPSG